MAKSPAPAKAELVIITGMSGSGKGSVIRALEDVGYYSVDNLPIELIPKFAELIRDSPTVRCAALVVDVREGESLKGFPALYAKIRRSVPTYLLPQYIRAGKSYPTIAFRFTGGHHRPVMIAEQIQTNLAHAGYRVKINHRDLSKPV